MVFTMFADTGNVEVTVLSARSALTSTRDKHLGQPRTMDPHFVDTGAPADYFHLPMEDGSFNAVMAMLASSGETELAFSGETQLAFQGQTQLFDFEFDLAQSQVDGPHLTDANIVLGSGTDFNELESHYPTSPSTQIAGSYSEDLPNAYDLPSPLV